MLTESHGFHIGDRVELTWYKMEDPNEFLTNGSQGVIRLLDRSAAGIEWDDYVHGHDLGGNGKYGHCWWVNYGALEAVQADLTPATREELFDFLGI